MKIKSKPTLLIMSLIGLLFVATIIIFISRPTQAAGVIYVNGAVSGGSNDGTSWPNAYSDLQSGLTASTAGDEIWVAKGVYTPGNTAIDTFQLVENVAIYGGFDGVETIRSERDWKTNLTVLSGDIDDNDTADSSGVLTTTANIAGTNSYHVVTGSGVSATAMLDGFTVTAGQATGADPHNRGGGLLNVSGSPTLINVTFAANTGNGGGGLFNNNQSNPAFTNVSFVANSAVFDGGAVFNNNQSGPTFTTVSFSANSAPIGGAVFNNNQSDPIFTNVTFSANSATAANGRGGGMLNANSNPTLINSILWGNSATLGASIHNDASTPIIHYSIVEGSGGSGNWSNSFGTDGGNNLDSDPLLAANLQLQNGSPAIDAGNTLSYTSMITTDLAGNTRIQNTIIDMGAFESEALTPTESIYLPSILGAEEDTSPTPAATPVPNSTETPTPVATQASTATPSATSVLVPGTSQITIDQMIEGVSVARTVYIQAPQSLDSSKSYPIVFALHGAGGSGQGFTSNEHLNRLINDGNFVGIYPNGHSNVGGDGGYWNLGTEPTTADDVEFVNLIVQKLGTYSGLNTEKIYGLGFSNGSGMINRLGKATTHFRAIAPMKSQQSTTTGALTPETTLSVFQLNGNDDTLIPINGGGSVVGEFLSAEASALNWVNHFNCSTSPVIEDLAWDTTTLKSHTYSNCDGGHEIRYYIAYDTGHSGFNSEATTSQLFTEIWAFFQQH